MHAAGVARIFQRKIWKNIQSKILLRVYLERNNFTHSVLQSETLNLFQNNHEFFELLCLNFFVS